MNLKQHKVFGVKILLVTLILFWQLYVQNSPTNVIFGVAITFLIVWELCPAIVVAAVVGLVNVLTTEDVDIPPVDVVVIVAAAAAAPGVGLVGDFVAAIVVVVTLPADVEPAVWPGDTTTGSVEGIGFPSLVCSFKTYKIWEEKEVNFNKSITNTIRNLKIKLFFSDTLQFMMKI